MLKSIDFFKVVTFVFITFICGMILMVGIIRGKCLSKGYKLSKMLSQIEERRILLERLEDRKALLINKERLFLIANKRGYTMMSEGRTYNVQ